MPRRVAGAVMCLVVAIGAAAASSPARAQTPAQTEQEAKAAKDAQGKTDAAGREVRLAARDFAQALGGPQQKISDAGTALKTALGKLAAARESELGANPAVAAAAAAYARADTEMSKAPDDKAKLQAWAQALKARNDLVAQLGGAIDQRLVGKGVPIPNPLHLYIVFRGEAVSEDQVRSRRHAMEQARVDLGLVKQSGRPAEIEAAEAKLGQTAYDFYNAIDAHLAWYDPTAVRERKAAADQRARDLETAGKDEALRKQAEEIYQQTSEAIQDRVQQNLPTLRQAMIDKLSAEERAQPPAKSKTADDKPGAPNALLRGEGSGRGAQPVIGPEGGPPAPSRTASALETAVLQEINQARTDPAHYTLKPFGFPAPAVEVGRSFLRAEAPLAPLQLDERLSLAASIQAADQGPKGQDSHTGSDSSTPMQRMQRVGVWSMLASEVISVSENQPAGVVAQLIVDPPDTLHLHRAVLFDPLMKFAGVACGPNAKFGIMCVIDLSGTPVQR